MKNRRTTADRARAFAFAAIRVVFAAGATAMWFTREVKAFALVALPTAGAAALLVVFCDWREKRRRRMLAERKDYRQAGGRALVSGAASLAGMALLVPVVILLIGSSVILAGRGVVEAARSILALLFG